MKNFKKVLALVLVVAMALSFATMSTAAFTDAESIAKVEAVDVLSAIGVINGYEDGSFKPEGTVTRAEMAKMIATILNKGEDVGDMYKGACTFADSANHWAAGYIAYCAQMQIINGKNASTFDPDATVTGTEAAKMMLGALGHAADKAGLTGPAWASTTLSLAKKYMLIGEDVNLTCSMNAAMTRQDAAQLMLNGLQAVMVEYKGGTNITIGNVVLNQGATATELTNTSEYVIGRTGDTKQYLVEETFNRLTRSLNGDDVFGRVCRVWTYEGQEVGTYSEAPYTTYTTEVTLGQVYTDLGKIDTSNTTLVATAPKYYKDGVEDTTTMSATGSGTALLRNIKSGNITDKIGGQGVITEVYFDIDTMTIRVCEINVYAGEIAAVTPAVKDANGDVTKEAYVQITAKGTAKTANTGCTLLDGTTVGTAMTVVSDAFTMADKGTIVYYTVGTVETTPALKTVVCSVAKATAVTGVNKGNQAFGGTVVGVTLDTTAYTVNTKSGFTAGQYDQSETIYLDGNNNAIWTTGVASTDFAYMMGAAAKTAFTTDFQAQMLFEDGSVKIVDLAAAHKGGLNLPGTSPNFKGVVSYVVNADGTYTVAAAPALTATAVTNKVPTVGSHVADVNTTFVVGTTDTQGNTTYATYTGISGVPTITGSVNAGVIAYAVNPNTGFIDAVFATDAALGQTASATVMALYKTGEEIEYTASATSKYYNVAAIVDGKVTTVKLAKALYEGATLTAGQFYLASAGTVDADGNYASLTALTVGGAVTGFQQGWNFDPTTFVGYSNGIVDLGATKTFVEATTPVYVWNLTTKQLQATTVDAIFDLVDGANKGTYITGTSAVPGTAGAVEAIYGTVQF